MPRTGRGHDGFLWAACSSRLREFDLKRIRTPNHVWHASWRKTKSFWVASKCGADKSEKIFWLKTGIISAISRAENMSVFNNTPQHFGSSRRRYRWRPRGFEIGLEWRRPLPTICAKVGQGTSCWAPAHRYKRIKKLNDVTDAVCKQEKNTKI